MPSDLDQTPPIKRGFHLTSVWSWSESPIKGSETDGDHHFWVLRAAMSSVMLKESGSLMSHSLRLKAINTIMCESRAAGVVLIDLPTNIRSIFYSPGWGNVLTLTRMGDSTLGDCGEGVFVEARASQHHTQLFNHVCTQHKLC